VIASIISFALIDCVLMKGKKIHLVCCLTDYPSRCAGQ
jgi:hypothetical protein